MYTQHSPRLALTLQNLIRGRLKEQQFPYLENITNGSTTTSGPTGGGRGVGSNIATGNANTVAGGGQYSKEKPQDIIVFIVGGVTYEEARMVAQINASSGGVRVVLGGTGVLNSEMFEEEVQGAIEGWPREVSARFLNVNERLRGSLGR